MSPDRQDKIFIVSQGEILEGKRIDTDFYTPKFRNILNRTKDFVRVGSLIKSRNRGDGPREGFYTDDKENGIMFLRVYNLKDHTIDVSDIAYINRNIHETRLKRTQVKPGDLIFAISGTKTNLGTVSIIPDFLKEGNLNSALVKLELDENLINKKFFCLMFDQKFVRDQIDFIGKGAAQNNLNNEEISSIKIPLPTLKIQQEIVDKMDSALAEKKNLENKSDEILNSIDDYVLSELGIELEKQEEKMYFSVDLKDIIENNRFDPSYFTNSFKIKKSDYELKNIYDIAEIKKGQSITQDNIIEGEYPIIAGGQTSPYSHSQKNYDGNVITISASGAYSGYVRYHEKPIFASDCSVVFSKDENFISTFFIYTWLKINQKEIYKMQKGAGQPHVYPDDIGNFIIPLPPREIQDKIVNEVKSRIEKANQLKNQANDTYEQAKDEVEKMILK